MMEKSELMARRHNSDSTNSLVMAVGVLSKTDFSKQMGSGILVRFADYTTGDAITGEFTVAAEDMEVIKTEILASLRRSLALRRVLLLRDISSIDMCQGPPSE